MNRATLKALKGSIKKWEGIVAGKVVDNAAMNCPLCQMFVFTCSGCPVAEKTGKDECQETPYDTWRRVGGIGCTAKTPQQKLAAKAELDFLKSLLPKKHKS